MTGLEQQVLQEKAVRNAARKQFDNRLMLVRHDLEEQSVPARLAARISAEARSAFDEAAAVAEDNKPVVAGTIAALTLWFFRESVLRRIAALFCKDEDQHE